MALLNKQFQFGLLKGTVYDFEVKGDVLPMHWHAPDNTHITIVGRASVNTVFSYHLNQVAQVMVIF